MRVTSPRLTKELVEELSTWQVCFCIWNKNRDKGNSDRYRGILSELCLVSDLHGNPLGLKGKVVSLRASINWGPWMSGATLKLGEATIPSDEFEIPVPTHSSRISLLRMDAQSSCMIVLPDLRLSVVFFAPGNTNYIVVRSKKRIARVSVRANPAEVVPSQVVSNAVVAADIHFQDWEVIESMSSAGLLPVEIQALSDLRRLRKLSAQGVVEIEQFFPTMEGLPNKLKPYYAASLRDRVNMLFSRVGKPYRLSIKADRQRQYWIRLLRTDIKEVA